MPIGMVMLVAFLIGLGVRHFLPQSIVRIVLVCGIATGVFVVSTWMIALDHEERGFLVERLRKRFSK